MNAEQMKQAKSIIKKHYRLDRDVTDQEVTDEINNLVRRGPDVKYMANLSTLYYQLEFIGAISSWQLYSKIILDK